MKKGVPLVKQSDGIQERTAHNEWDRVIYYREQILMYSCLSASGLSSLSISNIWHDFTHFSTNVKKIFFVSKISVDPWPEISVSEEIF